MEYHRFYSGHLSFLNPKIGSRNTLDEASESKQSPEVLHVLSNYRLHHRVYSMRDFSLAAM